VSRHARWQACRAAYFDRLATCLCSYDRDDGVDGGSVIGVPREGLTGEGRVVVPTADYGQSGRELGRRPGPSWAGAVRGREMGHGERGGGGGTGEPYGLTGPERKEWPACDAIVFFFFLKYQIVTVLFISL
jgi:hypothetical protein